MKKNESRHPASLSVFFATEMWERYGFYVVQTLLALYLVLHFKWLDTDVYSLVGSFTALAFLSPLVGGYIADHLLGQKRTILLGALILLGSYLGLGLTMTDHFINWSLAGITVGTGLLKPNISSLLGNEYPLGSPHRESGFIIFYMGLTAGIILGTTLPSVLNEYFNWSVSFISAAVGMMIAIGTFVYGIHRHQLRDYHPFVFEFKKIILALVLILILYFGSVYVLFSPMMANGVFGLVALLSAGYVLYSARYETAVQSRQTVVLGLLCLISVMFWAFYFQMFLSLTLFIERVVQPSLFGFYCPPPYYVGFQSLGMIILGFILIRRQQYSSLNEQGISISNKFLASIILMMLAYVVIVAVCYSGAATELLSPIWIIPAFLMISIAEMLLSPVGLSAVTLLASPKKVSTLMGVFLASLGMGAFLAGKLADLTAIPLGELSLIELKLHYAHSFSHLLYVLLAATLLSLILCYFIRRLMRL